MDAKNEGLLMIAGIGMINVIGAAYFTYATRYHTRLRNPHMGLDITRNFLRNMKDKV